MQSEERRKQFHILQGELGESFKGLSKEGTRPIASVAVALNLERKTYQFSYHNV